MQVYDKALTQEQMQAIQQQTEVVGEYVTNKNVQWKHAGFPGYQIGYLVMFSFCIKSSGEIAIYIVFRNKPLQI